MSKENNTLENVEDQDSIIDNEPNPDYYDHQYEHTHTSDALDNIMNS